MTKLGNSINTTDHDRLHSARVVFGQDLPIPSRYYGDNTTAYLTTSDEREYTDYNFDSRLNGFYESRRYANRDIELAQWQRLVEYAIRDLIHVWPPANYQKLTTQLQSNDFIEMGNGYLHLQNWCQTHATEHPELPMLRFIAATPPELGYTITLFRAYFSKHNIKETVRTLQKERSPHTTTIVERFQQMERNNEFAMKPTRQETAALQLADGALPYVLGLINEYTKNPDTCREELIALMPLMEAAIGVRGKRWQTEAPEHLRVLTKHYAELQWLIANPLLSEHARVCQEDILHLLPTSLVTTDDAQNQDKRLSWPLLLHKLCFTPDRLKAQYAEAGINDDTLIRLYVASGDFDVAAVADLAVSVKEAFPYIPDNPVDIIRDAPKGYITSRAIAKNIHINKHGIEDIPNNLPPPPAFEHVVEQAKEWFWKNRVLRLKHILEAVVQEPDALEKMQQLKPGFYRNFCLALRADRLGSTPAELEQLMALMKAELGDGAEVNRSADVVNGYVKTNYFEGTAAGIAWKLKWLLDRGKITEDEAENVRKHTWDTSSHPYEYRSVSDKVWTQRHRELKQEQKVAAEAYPTSAELLLFSDTVERTDKGETMLDPMYKAKYAARVLLPELERVESAPDTLKAARAHVLELMPEPSMFRDYFLHVLAQHELWQVVNKFCSPDQLAKANIRLASRTISLRDHFVVAGANIVEDAYMDKYPSVQVSGLVRLGDLISVPQKKIIADFLTDTAVSLTGGLREMYERQAVDLEIDHLRVDYHQASVATLGNVAEPLPAMVAAANDKAFHAVLDHVLIRFPKATHHRDSILFALMTDLATTEVQCSELERLTYRYQANHPGDFPPGEPPTFAATETMKHYLAMFSDRSKRAEVLLWLLGGDLPDDRYLASKTFNINEQDKVTAFWALSSEERRTIFYSALLGEGGICEVAPFSIYVGHNHTPDKEALQKFSQDTFELVFMEALADNPPLQTIGKIIFQEVMSGYSPARRVEFLVNLLEELREVKIRETKLRPGEALRMVLQGLGVVGVKVGQVLSERPDLISDETIRTDLGNLRDKCAPFNKRGVFAYARTAQLFQARPDGVQLTEIGECRGSASIKQVHKATTAKGEPVAFKVERPNTARNFTEDMTVLDGVVIALQHEGYNIPDWFVPEIRQLVTDELDFGKEASAARDLGQQIRKRGATIQVGKLALPVSVPQVLYLRERGEGEAQRIQLIVEEFYEGLSMAEIIRLQTAGTTDKELEPYMTFDVEAAQAGAAIDWLYQVADDGIFHADPHAGNSIVDLRPGHERYGLIDAGSVGRCETTKMKQDFLEFTVQLILIKQGLRSETEPVARIVHEYTGQRSSIATWQEVIDKALRDNATTADLFKDLVGSIMRVPHSTPDKNFHYLIKALASSGGNFEALQQRLQRQVMAALVTEKPEDIYRIPELQKLLPLLVRISGVDMGALMGQQ
ncbi:MAG: AarF/UbiB family protein [Patescibacteria group bacterium]